MFILRNIYDKGFYMNKKEYNKRYYDTHKNEINQSRNKGIQNTRNLLPGEIFEKLKVVESCGKDKDGKVVYTCVCECGKTRIVRRSYLLSGRTKSCGCQRAISSRITGEKYIHLANEARRKFEGSLGGEMWCRILSNAKSRDIEVGVTKKYAWELFLKQDKKCAITGLDLYLDPHHKNRSKVTASFDRIDSSKGYVVGNVQWVHKTINKMKWNLSMEDFRKMCKKVCEYDSSAVK